ncbi:MAG: putative DNA ligase [Patescibacteria group bacterium]|nr:MAG: putative DNA ligase [Patescibacteria group bacterium]
MKFAELAKYFDQLEETSSRLTLIDILSQLFTQLSKDEIDKVIYLTQGRVAPFFAPIEIGMADKMVATSLNQAFGVDRERILQEYAQKGDLGLVAYELRLSYSRRGSNLSIIDVFDRLLQIAKTAGEGSVEKKVQQFAELVTLLDAVSVKHLVRIALGNTRLGIGDPTILDGLAQAFLGDKSKRKLLEKAYNETSDLGLIGKTLLEGGMDMIQKLSVTIGRPVRPELCERLPTPEKVFEKMGKSVHAQFKYDGFRVQIHKNGDDIRMYSRNLEDMTYMFPELIEGTKKQIKAKKAILDTEALAYQPESEEFLPFQETTKRRRKHNIEEIAKKLPLRAFVFDVLYVDGKSLLDVPLVERLKVMQEIVQEDDILIPSPGRILYSPEELQLMLEDAISKGLEGVVVKRPDSLYEAGGRNFNWVKLKRHSAGELEDTIDCVILGYIYGRGKRAEFGAGALLCGVYDSEKDMFVTVTKIGTGLTDAEWRSIREMTKGLELTHKPARVNSLITPSVWVKPQIVIEVLADEITRSPIHTAGMEITNGAKGIGYALRFPRLVRFREKEKKPEDATTVKELIEIYKTQIKKNKSSS